MRKLFAATAIIGLLASTGCGPKPDDSVIRIGEYGALTGDIATFGQTTHDGIQMAIDEVNAAGGLNGKAVKLITEDDQSRPEQASLVVEKMITRDKVHAIIGEVASSNSLAAAPMAQKHKIPMVSPSSTNPKVTAVGDFIFRVCFIDPFQGRVMAKFAKETLKAKTAVILRDQKSDYGIGLADVFSKEFTAMGGTVIDDKAYVAGDVDFKAQLTSFRDKHPDILFVPGYYSEVGLIAKQARQLGIKQPLLGGDGWESPELFKIGGSAIEGCYFSNHSAPDSKDPQVVAFVKKHEAHYKKEPGALTMLGYDAAMLTLDAMKRAKSLRGPDIRDALAATKDYGGVTGKINIDADRNAVKSAVVLKVSKGKAVYVETVNP